jgi:hypothetical protein
VGSQAAKDVVTSYDALIELFECMMSFLSRLKVYTQIPSTNVPEMKEIIVKILVEVLSILALATKEIKRGCLSELSIC